MSDQRIPIVSITGAANAVLSKTQKTFNRLIKQIEKRRADLLRWEAFIPEVQQKYAGKLAPLLERSQVLRLQLVRQFDQAYSRPALTKTDRRTLAEVIVDLVEDLLIEREGGMADANAEEAELKALYHRYSGADYDEEMAEETAEELAGMRSVFEDAFGIDLGDSEPGSTEELLARMDAEFTKLEAGDEMAAGTRGRARKKTARQIAAEAAEQAQAQQIRQSIRDVYRKLASALHPDREADPAERDRKTILMQQINEAYAKNNLLRLLELQLQLEHIDQNAIANTSEERLRGYNAVLKEQLTELGEEIQRIEDDFRMQLDFLPFQAISPDVVMGHLKRDIAQAKRNVRDLERELLVLDDMKALNAMLKEYRRNPPRDPFDDDLF